MADADTVVLVCPSGAQDAPISEGTVSFTPFPEDPGNPHSRWLVKVPRLVALLERRLLSA
jgi:hypothetical protein